jgi:hypothetical protein
VKQPVFLLASGFKKLTAEIPSDRAQRAFIRFLNP